MSPSPKAVILLSGGLDSATTLAIAREQCFACYALSFDYGQRHRVELEAARRVADTSGVESHRIIEADLTGIGGSALTDVSIDVPESAAPGIPITYVPARNTIFLAYALAYAETLQAFDIFIGVNAVDYSGYPDCRPEFIEAFASLAKLGTRAGVEGATYRIHTPLIALSKADIIRRGALLGVDYAVTVSCYQPDELGHACCACDSCRIRSAGFREAGLPDPTRYRK